jgi:hypothetical protein
MIDGMGDLLTGLTELAGRLLIDLNNAGQGTVADILQHYRQQAAE